MMETAINKSFTESKRRLSAGESQRVDEFILKWQKDPTSPGISLERVQGALDADMWSARVTQDLRVILHRSGNRCLFLYSGHHDDAYRWAIRRRVRIHPVEGTLQIVHVPEVRLVQEEIQQSKNKASEGLEVDVAEVEDSEPEVVGKIAHEAAFDFSQLNDTVLLSIGVPTEWLDRVRRVTNEDAFLELDLPEEVWERLFRIAQNEEVAVPKPVVDPEDISSSLENKRRLHVIGDVEELQAILNRSFEEWMIFLHPSQRTIVEGQFNGPVKVTGVAGTGKTVVAMHRARHLAKCGGSVLLTTFTKQLCTSLREKLRRFCSPDEFKRIAVATVYGHALRQLRRIRPGVNGLVSGDLREHANNNLPVDLGDFKRPFVIEEFLHVVGEQGVATWEEYEQAPRVGRGTPLNASQRQRLWSCFGPLISSLELSDNLPWSFVCRHAREAIERGSIQSDFSSVIIDEVQDLSSQDIRFLASLSKESTKDMMLIGDAGQRIYSGGFSLRSMGIEVRGRSRVLKVNYRTTREIMQAASKLRDHEGDDLDEGHEVPSGVQDLLSGSPPIMRNFARYEDETVFVGEEIAKHIQDGVKPCQIALFAKTKRQRWHFEQDLLRRGVPFVTPDSNRRDEGTTSDRVLVSSMHNAKGLEFRIVFVVGCQQGQLPSKITVEMACDPEAKRLAVKRERNLLYVCMTRAREQLYVTWTGRKSEFLAN